MKRILLAALLATSFIATANATDYKIDSSHTQVLFTYAHMGYSHITGRFDKVSGTFDLDPAKLTASKISIEIPIASISTGVDRLNEHLQSADFFDAEKFPTATFKSTKVTDAGKGKLAVAGDLTIHGVTKPVVLDVTINGIGQHPMKKIPAAGFDARTTIKRSDFGMGNYVPAVGDEVTLAITLEAQAVPANSEK
ncbi:MAG TPA: YceI family protein [Arenimonas sp.]|uniref:YceI family protein n=1 Tax=Arenimonas sp. TaxID=1872635 RepID=UPI002C0032FA|nr:YceI family protein [Arenimonas sp.]HMB55655.1 YceI family protein [Arenimonas sp.]